MIIRCYMGHGRRLFIISHTSTRNANYTSNLPRQFQVRVSHFWPFKHGQLFIPNSHSFYKFTNKNPHLYKSTSLQIKFLFSECEKHVSTCRKQHNWACRTHVLIRYCTTIILCNVLSYTEGLWFNPMTFYHTVCHLTNSCLYTVYSQLFRYPVGRHIISYISNLQLQNRDWVHGMN